LATMKSLLIFLSSLFITGFSLNTSAVLSLDLSRFVSKLTKNYPKYFPNSSVAEHGIDEYKKFLVLMATSPDAVTPSKMIDEIWHNHILDTMAYMETCEKLFGKYLHHNPGFSSSVEEEKVFDNQYDSTLKLYKAQFGEPPVYFWPSEEASCGSSCGSTGCGGTPSPAPVSTKKAAGCGSSCGSTGCGGPPSSAPVSSKKASCGSSCGSTGCGSPPSPVAVSSKKAAACGSSCGSTGCGSPPSPASVTTKKAAGCGSSCGSSGCGSPPSPASPVTSKKAAGCGSSCGSSGCGSPPSPSVAAI